MRRKAKALKFIEKFGLKRLLLQIAIPVLFVAFAGHSSAKEMTFDIIYQNHTNVVVADGEIVPETPAAFQEFLDSEPFDGFSFYIDLNSNGGNLLAGIELGQMIRTWKLSSRIKSYSPRMYGDEYWHPTSQPGVCVSACALAFLGGKDRIVDDGSLIGFHQFSSPMGIDSNQSIYETEQNTQLLSGVLLAYIQAMGVSPQLLSLMSVTRPDEVFIPTDTELRELKIVPQTAFENFALEPSGNGVIATAVYEQNAQGRNVISKLTAYCRNGTPDLRPIWSRT